jgi:hypothetical protein
MQNIVHMWVARPPGISGFTRNIAWEARMISKSKSVLLTLVSTFFCMVLSTAPNSSVAFGAGNLPFHATFQGEANPVPTGECTLANTETGSGVALHLGKWTWSDQESVQFLACPPPGSAIAVMGQFLMVAANGDEIEGTFETTGTFDPVTGVSVQGGYIFVSGTGRFANVTGSGTIAAHGSATAPFDFVASLDGVISY